MTSWMKRRLIPLLEMETDNIVKKESNPAMIDKIQRMIMTEVEKR